MAIQGELTPVDFEMRSGDFMPIEVTVKDELDAVVDITGHTIKWGLYDGPVIGSELFVYTIGSGIVVVDAANGRFDVQIAKTDTIALAGRYHHEAELTDTATNPKTVMVGTVTIIKDRVNG